MQFGKRETPNRNYSREEAKEQKFTRGLFDGFEESTSSEQGNNVSVDAEANRASEN